MIAVVMVTMAVMMMALMVTPMATMATMMGVRHRMGIHLYCRRILWRSSRFVGLDMGPETVFVGYVVDVSVNSMGIFVAITALDFVRTMCLLMSILSVAVTVVDVIPEAVRLVVMMMVVMVIVMMMVRCLDKQDKRQQQKQFHF